MKTDEEVEDFDTSVSKLEEKCQFLFEKANRRFLKVLKYGKLCSFVVGEMIENEKNLVDMKIFSIENIYL